MPVEVNESCTVITGADIPIFQLFAVRGALRLEKVGLKHSGGSVRARWATILGLKPRDSHDKFIAAVEARIETLRRIEEAKARSTVLQIALDDKVEYLWSCEMDSAEIAASIGVPIEAVNDSLARQRLL